MWANACKSLANTATRPICTILSRRGPVFSFRILPNLAWRRTKIHDLTNRARLRSLNTDLERFGKFEVAASFLAMNTRSHPFSMSAECAKARRRRLIRFLITALPTRRPTAKPIRLTSEPFRRANNTSRGSLQLRPRRRAAAKSLDFLRRRSFCMDTRPNTPLDTRPSGYAVPTEQHPRGVGSSRNQTVSQLRPLNMRRFITLRPSRDLILDRKPWTLARRRFRG